MPDFKNFDRFKIGDYVRWQSNDPHHWNEGIIKKKTKHGLMIMKTIRQSNDEDRKPDYEWYDENFTLIHRKSIKLHNYSFIAKNKKKITCTIRKI